MNILIIEIIKMNDNKSNIYIINHNIIILRKERKYIYIYTLEKKIKKKKKVE